MKEKWMTKFLEAELKMNDKFQTTMLCTLEEFSRTADKCRSPLCRSLSGKFWAIPAVFWRAAWKTGLQGTAGIQGSLSTLRVGGLRLSCG